MGIPNAALGLTMIGLEIMCLMSVCQIRELTIQIIAWKSNVATLLSNLFLSDAETKSAGKQKPNFALSGKVSKQSVKARGRLVKTFRPFPLSSMHCYWCFGRGFGTDPYPFVGVKFHYIPLCTMFFFQLGFSLSYMCMHRVIDDKVDKASRYCYACCWIYKY